MRIALISNWGASNCGVANFGRDFLTALQQAGHEVLASAWRDPRDLPVDRVLVNWDSGTLPHDASTLHDLATLFVHHHYRGEPSPLPSAPHLLLSPIKGYGHYFPYPVPLTNGHAVDPMPRTLGVTTLRRQGVDYLQQATRACGWTLCPPDRWRDTPEEVERLRSCAALALWYSDSQGRSLALATALAARRPLLLSRCPSMFEQAWEDPGVYWADHAHRIEPIVERLRQIDQDLQQGQTVLPISTTWTWPSAVAALIRLWEAA